MGVETYSQRKMLENLIYPLKYVPRFYYHRNKDTCNTCKWVIFRYIAGKVQEVKFLRKTQLKNSIKKLYKLYHLFKVQLKPS